MTLIMDILVFTYQFLDRIIIGLQTWGHPRLHMSGYSHSPFLHLSPPVILFALPLPLDLGKTYHSLSMSHKYGYLLKALCSVPLALTVYNWGFPGQLTLMWNVALGLQVSHLFYPGTKQGVPSFSAAITHTQFLELTKKLMCIVSLGMDPGWL